MGPDSNGEARVEDGLCPVHPQRNLGLPISDWPWLLVKWGDSTQNRVNEGYRDFSTLIEAAPHVVSGAAWHGMGCNQNAILRLAFLFLNQNRKPGSQPLS